MCSSDLQEETERGEAGEDLRKARGRGGDGGAGRVGPVRRRERPRRHPGGTEPDAGDDNLYTAVGREIAERFRGLYDSFSKVMGAQMLISAINTFFTAAFLIWNGYPFVTVVIGLTFLFGMLPILGNLLSNTLIVGIGLTISPNMALAALVFLVVLHKGEYFLNSKIIGDRIRNPMWLTLLGLVIGEKLMGIPGMILAPVILHFVKVEVSRNKLTPQNPPAF